MAPASSKAHMYCVPLAAHLERVDVFDPSAERPDPQPVRIVTESDALMRAEQITDPARMAAMFAPGFPRM
jgi:hypothetical protein